MIIRPRLDAEPVRIAELGRRRRLRLLRQVHAQRLDQARQARGGTILSRMVDEPQGEGYSVVLDRGKMQVNLVKRWLDDAIRVETKDDARRGRWTHVAVTYDGSRVAAGVKVYLDGKLAPLSVLLDELNQSFVTKAAAADRRGGGPEPLRRRDRRAVDLLGRSVERGHLDPGDARVDRADPEHTRQAPNARPGAEDPPVLPAPERPRGDPGGRCEAARDAPRAGRVH